MGGARLQAAAALMVLFFLYRLNHTGYFLLNLSLKCFYRSDQKLPDILSILLVPQSRGKPMKQAMCTQAPCKHPQVAGVMIPGVMIPRVMDIPARQKCREQHPHCRHSLKDKQSPSSPALPGTWDSPSWVPPVLWPPHSVCRDVRVPVWHCAPKGLQPDAL